MRLAEIAPKGVVPVVVVDDAQCAAPLRDALVAGGLGCAEVTLRTPAALDALRRMADDPDFVVGAGTVLDRQQVDDAVAAGARFVVSPGLSEAVVQRCRELDVPVVPGAVTATEVMRALDLGLTDLKFFPAEAAGGAAAVAALKGPFPEVRFMPTGGIRVENVARYHACGNVAAVGGTWIAPADLQAAGNWAAIAARAADAAARAVV